MAWMPKMRHRVGSARGVVLSLQVTISVLSGALFATGVLTNDTIITLAAVLALFAGNLLHGCLDVKNRLLFLFLHAGIFLFLLTRPIFGELDPNRDWFLWTVETTMFALSSIYVSMLFLLLGSTLCSAIARHNECVRERKARMAPRVVEAAKPVNNVVADYVLRIGRSEKMLYIRRASFLLFIVCFAGAMYDGSIRLSYMGGMSYEEYYLIDSSEHIPWIVDLFRAMTPYVLCAYLATMPRKRPTAICFLMFIATSVPILLIGSRGDFVIDILFAALYFVFRSITDKEERWITKRMMVGVAILTPLGIFAMGLQNYLRSGQVTNLGFVEMLEDALFKQGVTFTVLGRAYLVNDQVQDLGFKFFTMGAFISNITEGFIGQTFLGCEALGSTNSAKLALEGNSYSHTMSYFAHYNYLGGEGYGSSYILEWFADFGWGGIAVGSFMMACAFYLLSRSIGKRWFWGMVGLISAMNVFHMPRGSASAWISFIWTTRFLAALVLVMAFAAVLALVSRTGTRQSVVAAEQSPPSAVARHCVALPRALPVCKPLSSKAANAKTNVYGIACIDLAQEKGRTDV